MHIGFIPAAEPAIQALASTPTARLRAVCRFIGVSPLASHTHRPLSEPGVSGAKLRAKV